MKNKKQKRAMIIILMTVRATIILMNVTLLLSATIIWIVDNEANDDDDDDGDQINNDGANFGKLLSIMSEDKKPYLPSQLSIQRSYNNFVIKLTVTIFQSVSNYCFSFQFFA